MIRFTSRVFVDLAIWMIAVGLIAGAAFPRFAALVGIPVEYALTPWFLAVGLASGLILAAINLSLAQVVVGSRLHLLANQARKAGDSLKASFISESTVGESSGQEWGLEIDSKDEIGETALAFNQLADSLVASRRTEAAVVKFLNMLSDPLEPDVLLDQALDQIVDQTEAIAGAILIEDQGELQVATSVGLHSPERLVRSSHVWRALHFERRQRVEMPDDMRLECLMADGRPRDMLVEPIVQAKLPLGAIVLASGSTFGKEALVRLDLLRGLLGLALDRALAHDRLQRLASYDPLTGALNRRLGMERLGEEFGRSLRAGHALGVIMLDIDRFKTLNDTYGHLLGDRFLLHLAKIARGVVRAEDNLIRYGGDEFLIILPDASKEEVGQIGERLRRTLEESPLEEERHLIRATISVGATAYPEFNAASELDMVRQADSALGNAKESGRNQVVVD